MRDICFRGKRRDDGQWEYGFLSYGRDGFEIVSTDGDGLTFHSPVDPKTVGQYTGLKDKNGTEIYEGDIILTQPYTDRLYSDKAKSKRHVGVVEYRIDEGNFGGKRLTWSAGFNVRIKDMGKFTCCNWSPFWNCEVIGNIYENPELLEVRI